MDNSKTIFEKEKRKERSKLVNIKFSDDNLFSVLDEDGSIKYRARLEKPFCGCPSFEYGNTEDYQATHADPFMCKHLIHAKEEHDKKIKMDSIHENTQGMINKELLLE